MDHIECDEAAGGRLSVYHFQSSFKGVATSPSLGHDHIALSRNSGESGESRLSVHNPRAARPTKKLQPRGAAGLSKIPIERRAQTYGAKKRGCPSDEKSKKARDSL